MEQRSAPLSGIYGRKGTHVKSLLSDNDFRTIVQLTNLFAIDLIVENTAGEILVGLRTNPPAKGYWFVPGGRVRKNELLINALHRIMYEETALSADDIGVIRLHGLYEHLYNDDSFGDTVGGTHYIVAACNVALRDAATIHPDFQHKQIKFMPIKEIISDPTVHEYVKYYFLKSAPNKFL